MKNAKNICIQIPVVRKIYCTKNKISKPFFQLLYLFGDFAEEVCVESELFIPILFGGVFSFIRAI